MRNGRRSSRKGYVPHASRNKDASDSNTVTVIDETGSAKGSSPDRYYLIVGAKINNRRAFNRVVYSYSSELDHELSFNRDGDLRDVILKDIAPYVDEVFYVAAYRPPGYEYALKQKRVHSELLEQIRSECGTDSDVDVLIIVDSNETLISEADVRGIINPKRENAHVTCVVLPSKHFDELQGHDFIVGAVGSRFNHGDNSYAEILEGRGVKIRGRRVDFPLTKSKESEMNVRPGIDTSVDVARDAILSGFGTSTDTPYCLGRPSSSKYKNTGRAKKHHNWRNQK